MGDEAVLHGDSGYWQHWWNMLHDPGTLASGRLTMDVIVPVDGAFPDRRWHTEFDREVRDYALTDARIGGRVIVPPAAIGSPAEPTIEMGLDHGFEVRVLPSTSRFAVYNGATAVLTERAATSSDEGASVSADADAGAEAEANLDTHILTRQPSVVEALVQLFELQWSAAIDWRQRTGNTGRILDLLARGWTDERISAKLDLSTRTVNRRVAELMQSTGASSRFALGMHVGRAYFGGS